MLSWDRSLLGKEFSRFEQHVTRAMLLEYADIIGAKDPVYTDPHAAQARGYRDMIALPTFVAWRGAHPIAPPEMDFQGTGINAGYTRPVSLTCTKRLVGPGQCISWCERPP